MVFVAFQLLLFERGSDLTLSVQCVSPDHADVQVQNLGVLQMHPQDCPSVGLSENVVSWEETSLHRDPSKTLLLIQAGWNALGPRAFGCSGQGTRGQEIKAENPCPAEFPADARDELYLHTWGQAPSHANGCAATSLLQKLFPCSPFCRLMS